MTLSASHDAIMRTPLLSLVEKTAVKASRVTGSLSQASPAGGYVPKDPSRRPPILRDSSLDVLRQLPWHGFHAPIITT